MPQDNQFGRLNNLYKEKICIKTKNNHIDIIQYKQKSHIYNSIYKQK